MLDNKIQSQLVDATAAMMRSCLTATTNAWAASACRGLSLWSEMLGAGGLGRTPARQAGLAAYPPDMRLWPSVANWMPAPQLYAWSAWPWMPASVTHTAWTRFVGTWPGPSFSLWLPLADWRAWTFAWPLPPEATQPAALSPSLDKPRAHATASFASYRSAGGHAMAQISAPATELVGLTAAATLGPTPTMLGRWRTAPGVQV